MRSGRLQSSGADGTARATANRPAVKQSLARARWPLLFAAIVASLAAGCFNSFESVVVRNDTSSPLTFSIVRPDGVQHDMHIVVAPGEERWVLAPGTLASGGLGLDGCTTGDFIAYSPDGFEVARHPRLFATTGDGDPTGG